MSPVPTTTRHASDADGRLVRAEAAHAAGDLAGAETLYRAILAEAPDHARALHNLGVIALRTGHLAGAEKLLLRAIQLDPVMAEAHSNLGLVLTGCGRAMEARAAFGRAVALRPDYADAWSNLGVLDQSEGDAVAAVGNFRHARMADPNRLEIAANLGAALIEAGEIADGAAILTQMLTGMPHAPGIRFNLGKARFLQGRLPEAIAYLRDAIALEPEFADAQHTLAHALLASGALEEGWGAYEWRWRAKRFSVPPRDFSIPRWRGESIAGKRILVWSEQGIGDKLLFAGLLPELSGCGADVTIEIEPRLAALFRRSFPSIHIVVRRDPPDVLLASDQFDLQAPIGDLPRYLRPNLDGFRPLGTYLLPDPDRVSELRQRYVNGRKPLVGIAWASRPPKGVPLLAFAPILAIPNVQWVNLQYGSHAEEIAEVESELGIRIVSDPAIDPLSDFDGSVAQTAAMDAVITIQNATLYVAGGLGLPTFALTPPEPDWRWLGCDNSPWHQTVRMFKRSAETGGGRAIMRLHDSFKNWLDNFSR